tara:strand:+ start:194 stop:595 length:402 start_codon:yes stop_codon:yes gene_type:complete
MKLTTARLKKLIREELNKIIEQDGAFYGSPEQNEQMRIIMTMFDVENGSKETARQASELAVTMGLENAVLNQLYSMKKQKKQKGRNMFQHEEDKKKIDSYITILQQVMDSVEDTKGPPAGTYSGEGPDLSDQL